MRVISWIRLEICPKFTSNQSRPGSRFRDDDCCHVGCGGWDPWRFRGVFFVCLQALGSWCLNGIYVLVPMSIGTKGHTLALCESFIWVETIAFQKVGRSGLQPSVAGPTHVFFSWKQRAWIAFTIHTFSYMIESMFKTDSTHWLKIMNYAIYI